MKPPRIILPIASLLFISSIAVADVPFNGMLLDGDMKPMKNVKIYVGDPNRYTKTDKKGRFGLTDVEPTDTLTLVFKKKEIIKVPVDGKKSLTIVVGNDRSVKNAFQDDELVNSGYGFVRRREFTGVSSGISGDRLRATGSHTILGALKGLVPGLNITGDGSGDNNITIRGQHSLTLSNTPLFIVDGIQVESLSFISIHDVDHVEVVKNASQYGAQGTNGAILVTTKTGALKSKK